MTWITDKEVKELEALGVGVIEWDKKREVIRLHDNEKFGVENWHGRKEYAPMSITEVEKRFMEVIIERAKQNG
jgi:hypothetical protein